MFVNLFGWGVSEEKIKIWKVNGRPTTNDGRQVMAKAHIAFGFTEIHILSCNKEKKKPSGSCLQSYSSEIYLYLY
jgi:hypothetical protein